MPDSAQPIAFSPRAGRRAVRFGVLALLGVAAVGFALFAVLTSHRASAVTARADAITASANRVLVDLLNAETAARGYVIAGQAEFLQPWQEASRAAPMDLARLERLTASYRAFVPDVAALRAASARKLAFSDSVIAQQRSGRHALAAARIAASEGRRPMVVVRERVARVVRRAGALPDASRAAAGRAEVIALIVDGVLIMVAVGLAVRWQAQSARARAALAGEARVERALRQVAVASASGEWDERALAALVAERIADLLDAPATSVVRFTAGRMTLIGGGGASGLPLNARVEARSAAGQVARTASTVVISDYERSGGDYRELARSAGARSAVAVPVFVGGELWGSLGALLHQETVPALAVELLERLAPLISAALANTQAQARLRQEARLERALRVVAAASASGELDDRSLGQLVAENIAALLDTRMALVVKRDDEWLTVLGNVGTRLPERVPLSVPSVTAQVIATGRPVRVDDYAALGGELVAPVTAEQPIGPVIGVPVRVHGGLWGSLVAGRPPEDPFAPESEQWLERFAEQVAAALAQADALAALRRQATTDGLTGLLNYRTFQERLQQELARATRHGRGLSLVMFDLDGFKLVNDLRGHSAGDAVLETVGRTLERERRTGDIPARVGGDEFALILPETTAAEALVLADRIRARAHAALDQRGVAVTLSAGVADLTSATTMPDLIRLVDDTLYEAKHRGRDRALSYHQ